MQKNRKNTASRVGQTPSTWRAEAPTKFSMPKKKQGSTKKKVAATLVAFVVLVGALIGADFFLSEGKVHGGVKVEGVAVGGMSKQEATERLQIAFDSKLAGASVRVKPDAESEERLAAKAVSWEGEAGEGDNGNYDDNDGEASAQNASSEASSEASLVWTFSAAELGASVDVSELVEEAYAVGQVKTAADIIPSIFTRFNSWIGGVDLVASAVFDEAKLTSALKPINDTIGSGMVNSNIAVDADGYASVRSGQTGIKVDEELFAERAQDVLLDRSDSVFDAPMRYVPVEVNDQAAQKVADSVNVALADPVTIEYGDHSWSVEAPLLGAWVTTSVQGEGNVRNLIASVDAAKAYSGLQELMGEVGYGSAKNASIDVSSGTPVIVGGVKGDGPDLRSAAEDLQDILFDTKTSRRVVCTTAQVDPALTVEDVSAWNIVEKIATFELAYGGGDGTSREFNIERCLDQLNNSLIAPGQDWHWNEVVGRCDETTGYKDAGAINDKNEFVQEPGGGICNVATGVFNAAYEAGFPILERANHSLYLAHYPLGRDAAVSWEYPTLAFTNDTENHILVTARYDGSTMFIGIWGTSLKRSVESKNSDWVETQNGGKSITNYRTVKASDGSIVSEDVFYSYFPPKKEDPKPQEESRD